MFFTYSGSLQIVTNSLIYFPQGIVELFIRLFILESPYTPPFLITLLHIRMSDYYNINNISIEGRLKEENMITKL